MYKNNQVCLPIVAINTNTCTCTVFFMDATVAMSICGKNLLVGIPRNSYDRNFEHVNLTPVGIPRNSYQLEDSGIIFSSAGYYDSTDDR